MATIKLTMAQALVKYLQAQFVEVAGEEVPMFGGMWAIFGHGNVAGLGEALHEVREDFSTFRAHNEQGMGLAACAYAKQHRRQRMMACTSSIGPGATNMLTAAGLAMTNRLPVLFLPGDTFASRTPDPVLQQVEHFHDPSITVNDCFRPVSRYFDRLNRPEQLLTSLPAAMQVLTDPALCGPATLALPPDVQTIAFDYPEAFFQRKLHKTRRPPADAEQLAAALAALKQAEKPLIVIGGGVHYSGALAQLQEFAQQYQLPVCETQAGKGAFAWHHPLNLGAIGVTGSSAANQAAAEADVVLAIGTRLQDFTTASRTLFANSKVKLIGLNVAPFDAIKHTALPLIGDARVVLEQLNVALDGWQASQQWQHDNRTRLAQWQAAVDLALAKPNKTDAGYLPTDANVIGVINRVTTDMSTIVQAAGGLPGELHKLWRTESPLGYHVEYGFSCMGYEIAGGMGVKMAMPERDVIVMVGDGSYLMLNSEIATSVMLGLKLTIVVLDNRGFACINRLQQACGGAPFNNLLDDCRSVTEGAPKTDFSAHARALGALAESVADLDELEKALSRAKAADKTYVIAIDTDSGPTTQAGGAWWDVAVPEISSRLDVVQANEAYRAAKKRQPY